MYTVARRFALLLAAWMLARVTQAAPWIRTSEVWNSAVHDAEHGTELGRIRDLIARTDGAILWVIVEEADDPGHFRALASGWLEPTAHDPAAPVDGGVRTIGFRVDQSIWSQASFWKEQANNPSGLLRIDRVLVSRTLEVADAPLPITEPNPRDPVGPKQAATVGLSLFRFLQNKGAVERADGGAWALALDAVVDARLHCVQMMLLGEGQDSALWPVPFACLAVEHSATRLRQSLGMDAPRLPAACAHLATEPNFVQYVATYFGVPGCCGIYETSFPFTGRVIGVLKPAWVQTGVGELATGVVVHLLTEAGPIYIDLGPAEPLDRAEVRLMPGDLMRVWVWPTLDVASRFVAQRFERGGRAFRVRLEDGSLAEGAATNNAETNNSVRAPTLK